MEKWIECSAVLVVWAKYWVCITCIQHVFELLYLVCIFCQHEQLLALSLVCLSNSFIRLHFFSFCSWMGKMLDKNTTFIFFHSFVFLFMYHSAFRVHNLCFLNRSGFPHFKWHLRGKKYKERWRKKKFQKETLQIFEENQRIGSLTRNSICEFDGQIIIENNIIAIEKDFSGIKIKFQDLLWWRRLICVWKEKNSKRDMESC